MVSVLCDAKKLKETAMRVLKEMLGMNQIAVCLNLNNIESYDDGPIELPLGAGREALYMSKESLLAIAVSP